MIRTTIALLLLALAGSACAQEIDQMDQIMEKCFEYEHHRDDDNLRFVRGQIIMVIENTTPIPESKAIFAGQGLELLKLIPAGPAQLAVVAVPPGEEHMWINRLKTYKPIVCGYLNWLVSPAATEGQKKPE